MSEIYNSIPSAHLLLSSLRSVGYTVETAVADIVDNSITAKSTVIDIHFDWNNRRIIISDNGLGMKKSELLEAMAIGSSDPDQHRDHLDLGRFGMGMKTAAFSLGKCLTVISKCDGILSNAQWDLDYIKQCNQWGLKISDESNNLLMDLAPHLAQYSNGTLVCISNIDKLISEEKSSEKEKKKFFRYIENVKKHLSLVFHRFIENDEIKIRINDSDVKPWNPFIPNVRAVQELEKEEIIVDGHQIVIQPYILPHKTKFTSEEDFEKAGGYRGWLHHQGFYVYRNRRLIIFGTWFGIFKKEISYNLARIQLDIYSDSDFDWQIDIKKSKAIPPVYAEDIIKRSAENAVKHSVKVYNSRGTYSKKDMNVPQLSYVWEQRKDSKGLYSFCLNKKHALLSKLKVSLNKEQKDILIAYLHLVEKCSPMYMSGLTDTISNKNSNHEDVSEIQEIRARAYELIRTLHMNGYEKEEIKNLMQQIAEYCCVVEDFDNIYAEAICNG